jgi:hypothetical protein
MNENKKGGSKAVYLNTGNGWSSTHDFILPESILTSGHEGIVWSTCDYIHQAITI